MIRANTSVGILGKGAEPSLLSNLRLRLQYLLSVDHLEPPRGSWVRADTSEVVLGKCAEQSLLSKLKLRLQYLLSVDHLEPHKGSWLEPIPVWVY